MSVPGLWVALSISSRHEKQAYLVKRVLNMAHSIHLVDFTCSFLSEQVAYHLGDVKIA